MSGSRAWLLTDAPASRRQAAWGRAYRGWLQFRRNRLAMAGLITVILLVFASLFAPLLATQDPSAQDLAGRLAPPSPAHWLGTDELGRDLYTRLLYGGRVTLGMVIAIVVLVAPVGLAVGTVAGYAGGIADRVLMRLTDIFLAFPRLILALAFVAALRPGISSAIIAIALTAWPPYARLSRAETLTFRQADFIAAVRLTGASPGRIVLRHIAPLCVSSLIVRVTLDMSGIILTAAGLGFLGMGAQPPMPEWGTMIATTRGFILQQWWVPTIPGLAIFAASLAFNLLGDGLRDVLDPKQGVMELLVDNLRIAFPSPAGPVAAVRDVSFVLGTEKLAIVGESGSGKSLTARAILRLLPRAALLSADALRFDGIDVLGADERTMRRIRGRRAGLVMQDPKYSLNPVMTAGAQIAEAWRAHRGGSRRQAHAAAVDLLAQVQIRDPATVAGRYPHELSGGMGQRVMIAMALAPDPELLIADEPTSALDATVQAEILRLIEDLVQRRGMGLILISHDLPLVSHFCDRVLVMYAGRVVEECRAGDLVRPQHPYTRGLLGCLPTLSHARRRLAVLERDPAWAQA